MTCYRGVRMTCSVKGCNRDVIARGWCMKHYLRARRHGDVSVTLTPNRHCGFYVSSVGYVMLHQGGNRYRAEHVVMAEKALGRALPAGVVVHHVDRDCSNNNTKSSWNLVVCPDQSYHFLLHRRAQALGYEQNRLKVSSEQAAVIRNSEESTQTLARRYGISCVYVRKIRSGAMRADG